MGRENGQGRVDVECFGVLNMIQDWRPLLKKITVQEIEEQIAELKDRIKKDQEEIVYLTILRRALLCSQEFRKITDRKAQEAIDLAIEEANHGFSDTIVKTDGEGKLRAIQ